MFSATRDALVKAGFALENISRVEGYDLAKLENKSVKRNHVCMKALLEHVLPKMLDTFNGKKHRLLSMPRNIFKIASPLHIV